MRNSKSQPSTKLFIKKSVSAERVLLIRCALVLALFALIFGIFWSERGGLKDQIDNDVSFIDVAYFTAVTVTTIGYGDVVPISEEARLIDTFVVTPLRLIMWLIFLGTAYELVLQKWWEARKLRKIQNTIKDHVIICGYGHGGLSAAHEAVAQGIDPSQIVVLDQNNTRLVLASESGHVGLNGNATHEKDLLDAGIDRAKALMICLGRDDAAVLTVLTARHLNSRVRIICSVDEEENIKLIEQAGADAIVAPSMMGGYLMTNFLNSSRVGDYLGDLMKAGGQVFLLERKPRVQEVGKIMRDVSPDLVVRLHRGDETIGFWEGDKTIIRDTDILLVIEPNNQK